MSIALGVWGIELEGGKTVEISPPQDIKITNVALGDVLVDTNERTSFKLGFPLLGEDSDDEDEDQDKAKDEKNAVVTVCSLTAGKIEQANVDIILLDEQVYKFQVVGKNTICLSGYYVDQTVNEPPEESGFPGFSDEDDDDEDVHDLRYVSSDVEMPPDGLDMDSDASDLEEDEKAVATGSKRGRDSVASNDVAKHPSKAEKKKNKKQKLQDGTAAVPGVAEKTVGKETEEKKVDVKTTKKTDAKTSAKKGEEKKTDGKKGEEKKDKTKLKEKELPSGLKIQDATIGTGPMAKNGQLVSMRYIGKLANGKIFDQNTKGSPFVFRLGEGEVIKGWDQGIVGMQVGGERTLTVPPALGYGKRGSLPQIPGNATLSFEVKCVSIK
ncbi:MAG: hypothetical protein NXY57DRAFT_1047550 [Lentinula lateritia]|uniref:FK506-binding protein n=1 Tax=Lentinula lateritia TaxID=40482 RepID=A0ABQ8VRK0_9AGAR|nr:MAG: hypothetical protein NXY57DRAFT_1047550 [Lentinula lateritia]KAJ4498105.1 hypothetical protein C8R41DRAFT_878319 [Lentinula lateritia]